MNTIWWKGREIEGKKKGWGVVMKGKVERNARGKGRKEREREE
jgi:hypothetical protein